jgi:hypothetical protein
MSPVGLRKEKGCASDLQQKKKKKDIENYRRDFSSERTPHITKSVTA